jgi:hypothetical protein
MLTRYDGIIVFDVKSKFKITNPKKGDFILWFIIMFCHTELVEVHLE